MGLDTIAVIILFIIYEATKKRKEVYRERRDEIRKEALMQTMEALAMHVVIVVSRMEKVRRLPEDRPIVDVSRDTNVILQRIRSLK
jgi:hypothetical protein